MSARAWWRRPRRSAGVTLPLTLAGCLLAAGCAAFSDDAPHRQHGGRLLVVTAFYPLQFVAERIAGDTVDIETLTRPGQEPHDIELTPRETGQVTVADLVVYEKGLQASVDEAVSENASGAVLDAAPVAGLEPRSHDGHDEQSHAGRGEDGELDPHFWLDPQKLGLVADAVRAALTRLDPADAALFRTNATALQADLDALDTSYDEDLAGCERHTIVVSHDAFGYLSRYGLDLEPIAGLSPDAEATPADLGRLQELIEDDGLTTVFEERLVPTELADSLAHDLGLKIAVLDPIEGLTDETSDQDYLSLMRANLGAIRVANGCP